jgi:Sortase domain
MTYRQKRNWIALAIVAASMVAGICLFFLWPSNGNGYKPRTLPVRAPSTTPVAPALASPGATPTVYARSAPTEIIIPAIHVDAPIVNVYSPCITSDNCPIDLTPLGTAKNLAGWWAGYSSSDPSISHSPGQLGPAVLVGHVNWTGVGNLVFANIDMLKPGDQIIIKIASDKSVTFVVSYSQAILKTAFPTASVYGPTPWPSLRLVTCTGTLLDTGHYNQSEIVYATEQ